MTRREERPRAVPAPASAMKTSYVGAIVAFGLLLAPLLVTGNPTKCVDRCQYGDLCYAPGQYWTDSSAGCVQFQCIATTNQWDDSTTYSVGALGCAYYSPPTDGTPYIEVPGDSSAKYPGCCDTIVLLQTSPKSCSGSS